MLETHDLPEKRSLTSSNTISTQSIDKFVDDLIADPNVNIYLIPDRVEKTMYTNTLKMFFSILQKTFNNISVDIIGHEFKMSVVPIPEKEKSS